MIKSLLRIIFLLLVSILGAALVIMLVISATLTDVWGRFSWAPLLLIYIIFFSAILVGRYIQIRNAKRALDSSPIGLLYPLNKIIGFTIVFFVGMNLLRYAISFSMNLVYLLTFCFSVIIFFYYHFQIKRGQKRRNKF
ncbi:hypothetical protein KW782_01785 [Candidatus Parcubacteria bacterium]|nr:hypothetical protein [Candidatus Parcubacteria bacterium]